MVPLIPAILGVVGLATLMAAVAPRPIRKPPIPQLVNEFLYFSYENRFDGRRMTRKWTVAKNDSSYKVYLQHFDDGDVGIRYLGCRTGVRFSEEQLMKLTID